MDSMPRLRGYPVDQELLRRLAEAKAGQQGRARSGRRWRITRLLRAS